MISALHFCASAEIGRWGLRTKRPLSSGGVGKGLLNGAVSGFPSESFLGVLRKFLFTRSVHVITSWYECEGGYQGA